MAEAVTVRPNEGTGAGIGGEASGEAAAISRRRMRRSYEAGHSPKFLVLVDDTPDCGKAVYYASRRAARVGAKVVLLRVIEPSFRGLGWLGVADIMQIEARQEAQELLDKHVSRAESVAAMPPETVIREGDAAREIFKLIEADEDVAMLVLAAGRSNKNPGSLVSDLARTAGTYPVPVVIVPAHLSDAELDALS
jgi:nucleotide-binding universal stress UspA family protein